MTCDGTKVKSSAEVPRKKANKYKPLEADALTKGFDITLSFTEADGGDANDDPRKLHFKLCNDMSYHN